MLQLADFDWRGAEAEYRSATALAPNDGEAKFYFGRQHAILGDVEPAIELTWQAFATEPLRSEWYHWLARYLSALNRLDEAERAIRRAIELQPAATVRYQMLTVIEVQRGNAQAALAAAQQEPSRMGARRRARYRTADRQRPERGRRGASDADREGYCSSLDLRSAASTDIRAAA